MLFMAQPPNYSKEKKSARKNSNLKNSSKNANNIKTIANFP